MFGKFSLAAVIAFFLGMAPWTMAGTWSLDSCVDFALAYSVSVRIGGAGVDRARDAVTEASDGYLPSVSAGASQTWNLGRGLTAENTYADCNTSSFSWNLSASLPIFDGLRTPRSVKVARANLAQVVEQYQAAREDITVNVMAAYLEVLYNKELLEVTESQLRLSESEVERRRQLIDAGKIPGIDLLEAQSQLASDILSNVDAANNVSLSLLRLANMMNYHGDISAFDVAPVDGDVMVGDSVSVLADALAYNHGVAAARMGVEAAEANILLARSGYMPTLSFGTSIGSSYYKTSGFANESFSSQMRHNYSTYFGFNLNIPLFDSFSTRNSVRRAKAERLNSALQLEQKQLELGNTIDQAYFQAKGALEKLSSCKVAEQYAVAAFEAMREKYNFGKANATEYEQANAKAVQATAQRIQAFYEYVLRARILRYYSSPH